MTHIWEPETTIDEWKVREIVKSQLPNFVIKSIEKIGEGFDFFVFLINEELVFKFPRRAEGMICLEIEQQVMPLLNEHLFSIPEIQYVGKESTLYKWPFIVYLYKSGTTIAEASLTEEKRWKLAETSAYFLKKLHNVPLSKDINKLIPEDRHDKLNISSRKLSFIHNVNELKKRKLFDNIEPVLNWVNNLPPIEKRESSVIVHGDFSMQNLLVNQGGNLSAVIDWGDIHLGDPAVDLIIVHYCLCPRAQSIFQEVYGEIDKRTWELARFRAMYTVTINILYADDIGNKKLYSAAIRSLTRMVNVLHKN
jgi:aminoglycoside phosphotransferase (APT) family kinase protein